MNSQHPILRAFRRRSSISLPHSSRFSFSLAPNGPFNTPVVPSVYITVPEEEGSITWCAIDGEAPFSLDVPLPDVALLERTIEGLRKAATTGSRSSTFRRPSKRDSVISARDKSEEDLIGPEDPQALESQTPRQQRIVFADASGRIYPENLSQRPMSPMRVASPPPDFKRGTLRMRASKVLQVLRPHRSHTSPSVLVSASSSSSENRSTTPASLPVSNGRFGSKRFRRGMSQMFKRGDFTPPPAVEETSTNPLGIHTLPHQLDQVLPSFPSTPSTPQHATSAQPPFALPATSIKTLPPLPAYEPTTNATYPTLQRRQSSPGPSLTEQLKRRFSLTDLRQKWMQPSRTGSSTSTAEGSTESSGSSAGAPSVDQDVPRPTSRSPGRRMVIESMHFPDLDLRFDDPSF